MRFREIAAEAQAYERKRLGYPRRGFGRIVDLFGDFTTEELTPLLIEEKLESIAGVVPKTVTGYRSKLSFICKYAVEKGVMSANPVIPRSRIRRRDNEQLIEREAIELRDRVIEHRKRKRPEETSERDRRAQDRKRTEGLAKLQRDGISLIRRIAGNPAADMVQALCGLSSSHLRGPRTVNTKKAYARVVSFVAQNPEASDYKVGKHCGTDRKLVEQWRKMEQFAQDLRVARHEVPTEEEIAAANAKARKTAIANDPEVVRRKSETMTKKWAEDPDYAGRVRAGLKKSNEDPKTQKRRSEGARQSWKRDRDRRIKANRKAAPKISASVKNKWRDDPEYQARQNDLRKDPDYRAQLSLSVKKSWDDRRRRRARVLSRTVPRDHGRFSAAQ